MTSLSNLERAFQSCVLDNRLDMAGQVAGTARAGAEERIGIYVEGYRLRLLEILDDNFSGLRRLMGEARFAEMGRAYIHAHPSTHPSVRWFGRHMEAFLRTSSAYSAEPALAEMAAFEWAQGLAFDAADMPPVTLDRLAALPPESWASMAFRFHPSVQRRDFIWNVPAVWQALDHAEPAPALDAAAQPVAWLLWRADLLTHWRSLDIDEAWALDAARDGADFAAICEGLCQWQEEAGVALQAAGLLKRWVTDGLLTAVETP